MGHYDLYLMGSNCRTETNMLRSAILTCLDSAGVESSTVTIYSRQKTHVGSPDGKRPAVAVCFKDVNQNEMSIIRAFVTLRVPIIPLRREEESFADFPHELQRINGLDFRTTHERSQIIASAMLDAIGLLREQRRVFVSYRRNEAMEVAIQLFDRLSASGYDVFLDTHSISPGEDFQESLWHQLCDSDVVVMLDTPNYFSSRWTTEEFGRAQSAHIHILRLVWPSHKPSDLVNLSQPVKLSTADLHNGRLTESILETVVDKLGELRARSIASRHTMMSGKLVTGVRRLGGSIAGVGVFRAIRIRLPGISHLWVYPVVGVPTARIAHNIALLAEDARHVRPFLMFDDFGISEPWLDHLSWLNERVPEVDFMKASIAADELSKRTG